MQAQFAVCCKFLLCCFAGKDLATIGQQFPFEPLEYQQTNLRLPFEEGIKMLQEAGYDVSDPAACTCLLMSQVDKTWQSVWCVWV